MKKFLYLFLVCCAMPAFAGDCGSGYVLVDHAKVDGMVTKECQKLWCHDLETGKVMGTGNTPANGYVMTSSPMELCDADGNCIECFGDRKWCSGASNGVWNPEYGAYTRGGADSATYSSRQKGGCFTWQLGKPSCANGEDAILKNGEWVCALPTRQASSASRASAVRRTGTTRRMFMK